jgi:hypothetical protein
VTVIVEVRGSGKGLRARVNLVDADGRQKGDRTLEAQSGDCAELISSVALAVSIALDSLSPPPSPEPGPSSSAGPAESEPPHEAAPPPPSVVDAPSSEPPPVREATWGGLIALGVHGSLGTAPAPAGGLGLLAQVSYGALAAGLEGRYDLPASTSNPGVSTQLAAVSILPCFEKLLFGCLVGSYGAIFGSGAQLAISHNGAAPYAAVGARAGFDAPLAGPLGVRAYVEVAFPITSTSFRVDSNQVWVTPPISGAAGLLARVRFP